MGVIIPVDAAQANIVLTNSGKIEPMVMTVGMVSLTLDTAIELANAMHDTLVATGSLFSTAGMAGMFTTWAYQGVNVTLMTSTGPVMATHTANQAGSASGAGLVINGCILVRKSTARGGRKGRGRLFVPPYTLGEADVAINGDIAGATVTVLQSRFNAWLAAVDASAFNMTLLHSEVGLPPDEITGLQVQGRIATQRRRLR